MKILQIILCLLILTLFFDFIYIPGFNKTLKWVCLFANTCMYVYSFRFKDTLSRLIHLYCTLVLLSCINTSIFHGQIFYYSIYVSYFALGLLSYFFIQKIQPDLQDCLKALASFSIIFCLCYIFQWIVYPTKFFMGAMDEFSIGETYFRMRMSCSICAYYLIFYGIYLLLSKKTLGGILFFSLGFTPAIIMGFRSLMFLTVIFILLMLVEYLRKNLFRLILGLIISAIAIEIILQVPLVQDKIDDMMVRQERDENFSNSDYVRYISLDYYYNNVHSVPTDPVVGSGIPFLDANNPYTAIFKNGYSYNLYWNDLGIIGLALLLGFPAIILLSYILLRYSLQCRNKELLTLKYTILTVFVGSIFTSQELFRSGNFVVLGLMLYIYYKYQNNENRNYYVS